MNTLPLTVAILALLTMTSLARLHRSTDEALMRGALTARLEAAHDLDNQIQARLFTIKKHTNNKPGPAPGSKRRPRNPDSTPPKESSSKKGEPVTDFPCKLNLAPILQGGDPVYERFFLNLLEVLHKELLPSRSTGDELLRQLKEKVSVLGMPGEAQGEITRVEQLAALRLDDPEMQELWFSLLRSKEDADASLLDFVCVQRSGKSKKINITFAPTELLLAIFQNEELVQSIKEKSEALIATYDRDNQQLKHLQNAFETHVAQAINDFRTPIRNEELPLFDYRFTHKPGSLTVKGTDQPSRDANRPPKVTLKRHIQYKRQQKN